MAWLPDGRLLVTGKQGTLHLVTGGKVQAVSLEGLPTLMASGQGGLLDIAVHPLDKGPNVRVYMTMAHGSSSENRTILVCPRGCRGRAPRCAGFADTRCRGGCNGRLFDRSGQHGAGAG